MQRPLGSMYADDTDEDQVKVVAAPTHAKQPRLILLPGETILDDSAPTAVTNGAARNSGNRSRRMLEAAGEA